MNGGVEWCQLSRCQLLLDRSFAPLVYISLKQADFLPGQSPAGTLNAYARVDHLDECAIIWI